MTSACITRRRLTASAALLYAGLPLSATAPVQTQDYPAKPIHTIVAYPTGDISDNAARVLGEKLSAQLDQPVVMENRADVGGSIGMDAVAKAAPDGYTLGFSSMSLLTLSPYFGKLPYDPQKDIASVTNVMYAPMILLGTPPFTSKNLADVLSQSRAKPSLVHWPTPGLDAVERLVLEQIKSQVRVDVTLIPYKGGSQQLTDALGGQVEAMSTNAGRTLIQHITSSELHLLAVDAPHQLNTLSNVLTFTKPGYAKASMVSASGVSAPARMPTPVIAQLNAEINKALAVSDLRERLTQATVVPAGGTAEQFAATIRAEYDSDGRIVCTAGIKEQ